MRLSMASMKVASMRMASMTAPIVAGCWPTPDAVRNRPHTLCARVLHTLAATFLGHTHTSRGSAPTTQCLGPRLPTLGTILTELARVCSGPRAEYADILNDILNYTDYSILNHTNYTTRCGDRPPCVALIVDDPTYDAGLNEGIVARLNVSIPGYVAPGIQIVYGNVGTEVDKAEKEVDQPYPYP